MRKKALIAAARVALVSCVVGGVAFLSGIKTAEAENKPVTREYAVSLDKYIIENYSSTVEVTAPNGDVVNVSEDGSFIAIQFGGIYTIEYVDKIVEIYVYQQKPAIQAILVGNVKEDASVGEKVIFPSMEIYSGIEGYEYYDFNLALIKDGEENVLPVGACTYTFDEAGDYTVEYRYEDVFKDVEVAKTLQIEVLDERTILANELPTRIGINNTLSLKNIVGYYRGVEYPATIYVKTPEDSEYKAFSQASLLISQTGNYKIKAVTEIQGATLEKEFVVESSVCSSSLIANSELVVVEEDAITPYYSVKAGEESIGVSNLTEGATFTYAKLIDVSELTKNDNLISFDVDGTVAGSNLSAMNIRLVDAHDSTNFIGIYIWKSIWNNQASFCHAQYDKYQPGAIFTVQPVTLYDSAFDGAGHLKDYGGKTYPFTMQYDALEQALYTRVRGVRTWIKDLADPRNKDAWRGFTGNEAYLEVTFVSGMGKINIFEIAGESVTRDLSGLRDDNAIFFENKVEETLHDGAVDYPYPLPISVENKLLRSSVELCLKKGAVDISDTIEDSTFTPTEAGNYSVTYSVNDAFGNLIEKTFAFEINATPNTYIWDTDVIAVKVMDYLTIPDLTPTGGNGPADIEAVLELDGVSTYVSVGKRYQITSTDAKLIVKAVDKIEYSEIKEYEIAVEKYIYIKAENMPKTVRAGEEIIFPDATALDFTKAKTDEGYILPYTVTVNGVALGLDRKYTVPMGIDTLSVVYAAENAYKEYALSVLPEEIAQASGFVLTESAGEVTINDFASGAEFAFTADTVLRMPYAVSSSRPAISFSILRDDVPYDKVQITFTEIEDEGKQVVIEFSDLWGTPVAKVLGSEKAVTVPYSDDTYAESDGLLNEMRYRNFYFAYSNSEKRLLTGAGVAIIDVTTDANGIAFDGFNSGVFLEIKALGVKNEGKIILNSVCNQSMVKSNRGADRFGAEISFDAPFYSMVKDIDSMLIIPAATAYDVLQRTSVVTLSVIDPSGNRNTLDSGKENLLLLDQYGEYELVYETKDAIGNSAKTTVKITVLDLIAPEVTVSNLKTEYKVGETFVLPNVSVTDIPSEYEQLQVEYLMYAFDGSQTVITDTEYTFVKSGSYKFVIYVKDAAGNITVQNYELTVR